MRIKFLIISFICLFTTLNAQKVNCNEKCPNPNKTPRVMRDGWDPCTGTSCWAQCLCENQKNNAKGESNQNQETNNKTTENSNQSNYIRSSNQLIESIPFWKEQARLAKSEGDTAKYNEAMKFVRLGEGEKARREKNSQLRILSGSFSTSNSSLNQLDETENNIQQINQTYDQVGDAVGNLLGNLLASKSKREREMEANHQRRKKEFLEKKIKEYNSNKEAWIKEIIRSKIEHEENYREFYEKYFENLEYLTTEQINERELFKNKILPDAYKYFKYVDCPVSCFDGTKSLPDRIGYCTDEDRFGKDFKWPCLRYRQVKCELCEKGRVLIYKSDNDFRFTKSEYEEYLKVNKEKIKDYTYKNTNNFKDISLIENYKGKDGTYIAELYGKSGVVSIKHKEKQRIFRVLLPFNYSSIQQIKLNDGKFIYIVGTGSMFTNIEAMTEQLLDNEFNPISRPYYEIDYNYDVSTTNYENGPLFIVTKSYRKYGYENNHNIININGEEILDEWYHFKDYEVNYTGIIPARNSEYKWGFMNIKGEIIIPFIYHSVEKFKNGVAKVWKNKKKSFYIDTNGEKVKK